MPKRWKVASTNSFTWQYVLREKGRPLKVLAQSVESWETRDEVKAEIDRMKRNNEFDEDDE